MCRIPLKALVGLGFILAPISFSSLYGAVTTTDSLEGVWEGTVAIPDESARIILQLSKMQPGEWRGTLTIPVQGITRHALDDIHVNDRSISLGLPTPIGPAVFSGQMSVDGRRLEGETGPVGAALHI